MSLSVVDLFIISSILQGLLLGAAILRVAFFSSPANRYLGWFLVLLTWILFLGWQEFDVDVLDWVWTFMWEYLLAAVLFSYFLKALEHPLYDSWWRKGIFAVFWISLLVSLVIDLSFAFGPYALPFTDEHPIFLFFEEFEDTLSLWLNAAVIFYSLYLVRSSTSIPDARRQWLLRFCYALCALVAIWYVTGVLENLTDSEGVYLLVWMAVAALMWWVAYAGVYKLRILEDQLAIRSLRTAEAESTAAPPKVEPPTISGPTPDDNYAVELDRLMKQEHLYRNPDLGRRVVADALGISEGYVSEVMRKQVGQSFAEYVNNFRITEAKSLLRDAEFAQF